MGGGGKIVGAAWRTGPPKLRTAARRWKEALSHGWAPQRLRGPRPPIVRASSHPRALRLGTRRRAGPWRLQLVGAGVWLETRVPAAGPSGSRGGWTGCAVTSSTSQPSVLL